MKQDPVDHGCEDMVELPLEEGEKIPTFRRCGILALRQCQICRKWLCGTEDLNHAIACVKCDGLFCQEHYRGHVCNGDLGITEEDIQEFAQ